MKGSDIMFVYYKKDEMLHPIKIWLEEEEDLEESCLKQALNLSNLPFLHKWACLMPDTHTGKGMPIGGVIATEGVVIPNAVGVDIGCGMAFVQTDIPVQLLRDTITGSGTLLQAIIGDILRNIPTGYNRYKKPQVCEVLDQAKEEITRYQGEEELLAQLEEGYYQVGTLGGGNHFIELQQDEKGMVCIMLHSGSRHFGNVVGQYFNRLARDLNDKWYSSVPSQFNLPFLPVNTEEGQRYINWMNLSLDFAYENRRRMLDKVKDIFSHYLLKYNNLTPVFTGELNCHHNYAALESHFDKNVWVHRKGATRVREGELAIIPGAMGSYSYIVRGKGNEDSFHSSSHGAGRKFSRTGAKENFSVEKVINDLKNSGVVLGKYNKKDVAEEARFAYKDIDEVMANQIDLVDPVKKLFTIGVVKG